MKQVIKITPRGYCYGVVDALQMARQVARDPNAPRPIYMLGAIVHNRHAVEALEADGIISLDGPDRLALLEQIDSGTVIFTAHGVSPAVKQRAREKGLHCVDATCPEVTRTHDLVKDYAARDYDIIYVGKKGHPEPAGVIGEAPDRVHLVENEADIDALTIPGERVMVTTQTTLSKWDTQHLIDRIRERYPHAEIHNEICLATQERQEAAVKFAQQADLVLVVGDRRSNNSNRLVEVVQQKVGKPAVLIDSVEELDPALLEGHERIAITSGSSTPTQITRKVIKRIEQLAEDERPPD